VAVIRQGGPRSPLLLVARIGMGVGAVVVVLLLLLGTLMLLRRKRIDPEHDWK
jgi:hypothetical protein